jgi:hypothetical protein
MSINFIADNRIQAKELFDGRLKRHGISQGRFRNGIRYLADDRGLLRVFLHDSEFVDFFATYLPDGDPSKVLLAIQKAFKTKIYEEDEYWALQAKLL